jgi:hypothetical protein
VRRIAKYDARFKAAVPTLGGPTRYSRVTGRVHSARRYARSALVSLLILTSLSPSLSPRRSRSGFCGRGKSERPLSRTEVLTIGQFDIRAGHFSRGPVVIRRANYNWISIRRSMRNEPPCLRRLERKCLQMRSEDIAPVFLTRQRMLLPLLLVPMEPSVRSDHADYISATSFSSTK